MVLNVFFFWSMVLNIKITKIKFSLHKQNKTSFFWIQKTYIRDNHLNKKKIKKYKGQSCVIYIKNENA